MKQLQKQQQTLYYVLLMQTGHGTSMPPANMSDHAFDPAFAGDTWRPAVFFCGGPGRMASWSEPMCLHCSSESAAHVSLRSGANEFSGDLDCASLSSGPPVLR